MGEDFDADDYVLALLATNESNDCIRKRIQTDIESTRRQLSDQLLSFDIDLNELNTNYNDLMAMKKKMNALDIQLNTFIESDLLSKADQLKTVCRQNNDRLMRSQAVTNFTDQLKQIYDEINSIDQSFSLNLYHMSFKHMNNVSHLNKQLIQAIDSNDDLKCMSKELISYLDSITTDLVVKREELIYNTKTMFNSNIKAFKDEFNNEYVFEFNLIQCLKSNEYKNYMKAFVEMRENEDILKDLIKSLNLFFIKTILNEEVNQIVLEGNKITATLSQTVSTSSPLSLLKLFFDYLSQTITDGNSIPEGRQLLRLLGQYWTQDIFDQILKYYLNRLMPKNESEIKSYLSLVDSAEDIRHFLIEIGLIDDKTNSPFIEFALNINSHFCRTLCTDFLLEAKAIICRDLHQTVEVGTDDTPTATSFPKCRVSQLIVELKQLVLNLSDLCPQCSTECSDALIQTMADICELYVDISPVYHNKLINEFPQQNAIFHNNCLFLANFIETFALKYKLKDILGSFVPIFREIGSQVFLKQMRTQEKLILDLVQSHEFSHCINDLVIEDSNTSLGDQLANQFRQTLKQCLVHLNFLRQTLVDVLPQRVYDKAIGTVINTLFNGLINKIMVQNDISSSGAQRLSHEIEFLLKDIQTFLNTENPMRLVSKWTKLSELNFILNANLLDIVNRWADGCGILAAEFTAQDVKQLIRVLFQNTERRAQALNRITSH